MNRDKECMSLITVLIAVYNGERWLVENSDKAVFTPGYGKREGEMSWGFKRLLPEEWIKC